MEILLQNEQMTPHKAIGTNVTALTQIVWGEKHEQLCEVNMEIQYHIMKHSSKRIFGFDMISNNHVIKQEKSMITENKNQ